MEGAADRSPRPLPGQTAAAGTEQAWRTQQRVVHRGWGKPLAPAGELLLLVGLEHLACRRSSLVRPQGAHGLAPFVVTLPPAQSADGGSAPCGCPRASVPVAGGASARNQEVSMPSMPSDPHHEVPDAIQGYVALIGAMLR